MSPAPALRLITRTVGLLALALAAVTCSDAPTAPAAGGSAARLGLSPSFSVGAARAYRALAQLGFEVTSAHVRLTAADGRVAADTVVSFPASQDTLRLDLSVQIEGAEETFTASIELRDGSGLVLFAGTRAVTARALAAPGIAPAPLVLEYAGPGRAARSMVLAPATGTVSANDVVPLTATAVDSAGRPVPDLLVRWTASDSSLGRLTTTASAAAELHGTGTRGTVTVHAVTPTGLSASASISLVPPATRLVVVGGDGQSGVAGRPLANPFVVEARAADGGPVPNTVVAFRAVSAGAKVATPTAAADSAGRAGTIITSGTRAGSHAFEASAPGLAPVSITATAAPAPPATIAIVSGSDQREQIGRALEQDLVVIVTDEFGLPSADATVEWSVAAGAGDLRSPRTTTGVDGRSAVSFVAGRQAGPVIVRATLVDARDASVEFSLRVDPSDASTFLLLQPIGTTQRIGVPPANVLRVRLADAEGNPVAQPGLTVTIGGTVTPGNVPPFTVTAASDDEGIVTFDLPAFVGALGTATLTVSAPGFAPLVLPPITFVTGPVAKLRVATQPSASAWSGSPLSAQPVVQLADAGGNVIATAGVPVTAYLASGSGTLSGTTTALTDASGAATFTDLVITGPGGRYALGFSSAPLKDAQSSAIDVASPAAALEPVAGYSAPASTTNGAVFGLVKVRLVDAAGDPVARAGVPITLAATALSGATPAAPLTGTTTRLTDPTGVATFDDVAFAAPAGDYRLTASADPSVVAVPTLTLVALLTLL